MGEATKRATTGWQLLVWAYRIEHVRHATRAVGGVVGPAPVTSPLGRMADAAAGVGAGSIGAWLAAHEDAVAVGEAVWSALGEPGRNGVLRPTPAYWAIVKAAEAGHPPDWQPRLTPLAVRPVMRMTPAGPVPRIVYRDSRGRHPSHCPLDWVGTPPEAAAKARAEAIDLWLTLVRLLDGLAGLPLIRWQVTGPGIPRFPWIDREGRIIDNTVQAARSLIGT